MALNLEFQPFNFANIPGAVRISGEDLIQHLEMYEPPGHPIYIAPEIPWHLTPTNLKIPPINFNDLINLLDKILGNTGKLEINKIHKWCYSIEFQPVDGIKMYPKDILHRHKWWSMMTAVNEAIKRFPHNLPEFDPHEPLPDNFGFRDEWFKMEIRIYYCKKEHSYIIEFNRMRGEATSFYKIYKILESQIKETFSTANILWLMRKNYIDLSEGSPYDEKFETQISRYLFNPFIVREICSYIGF
jgi:hypothetical protein